MSALDVCAYSHKSEFILMAPISIDKGIVISQ